jgi:hypothetical protein
LSPFKNCDLFSQEDESNTVNDNHEETEDDARDDGENQELFNSKFY